jgi:hypothetical protein
MIERVERALLVPAYTIELDGDVHVPMCEEFEAKLADLRSHRCLAAMDDDTPEEPNRPSVVVCDVLTRPHWSIRDVAKQLRECQPDRYGKVCGGRCGVRIAASPPVVDRALRIADALVKAFLSHGCKIHELGNSEGFVKAGLDIWISISERSKQIPHRPTKEELANRFYQPRKFDHLPTGRILIEAHCGQMLWRVQDDGSKKVEHRLGEFVALIDDMPRQAREIAEREEAQRLRLEELDRRREKRLRVSESQRRAKETLEAESAAWQRVEMLRRYIAHVEERVGGDASEVLQSWIVWAGSYVDSLDPTEKRLQSSEGAPLTLEDVGE